MAAVEPVLHDMESELPGMVCMASDELAALERRYYMGRLEPLDEPGLTEDDGPRGGIETFRVLRFPSFRPSISVRVEIAPSGIQLIRSVSNFMGAEHWETAIDESTLAPVAEAWRRPELWRHDRKRRLGLDGETWMLEWRDRAAYRRVESWSPDAFRWDPDVYHVGNQLLSLASQRFGVLYY